MNTEGQDILDLIDRIEQRLDDLESSFWFTIPASSRFSKGDRVKFNNMADRRGVSKRTKNNVKTGTVLDVAGFSIKVMLDGYTTARSYHHMFFDGIN